MASHFVRGALIKNGEPNAYIPVTRAKKNEPYICPGCGADVIFRAGEVREHHFAHKPGSSTTCSFYDPNHSNESDLHKHAKLTVANILETRKELAFDCWCDYGHVRHTVCCERKNVLVDPSDRVVVEHRTDAGTVYDVAVLNSDGTVKCVVEIKHTHATETVRPEPWFEVLARDVLVDSTTLSCQRVDRVTCPACMVKREAVAVTSHTQAQQERVCSSSSSKRCKGSSWIEGRYFVYLSDHDDPKALGLVHDDDVCLYYNRGEDCNVYRQCGIYLDVNFEDKDRVKARGARWDPDHKRWYVPASRFYRGGEDARCSLVYSFGYEHYDNIKIVSGPWLGHDKFAVRFPGQMTNYPGEFFDFEFRDQFREAFPHAQWDATYFAWVFPIDSKDALLSFFDDMDHVLTDEVSNDPRREERNLTQKVSWLPTGMCGVEFSFQQKDDFRRAFPTSRWNVDKRVWMFPNVLKSDVVRFFDGFSVRGWFDPADEARVFPSGPAWADE